MRKIFILCFVSCSSWIGAHAQFSHGPFVGAGYAFNGFHTDNLNNFVRTFNDYYSVGMQQAFTEYDLSTMNGFYVSMGWRLMKRHRSGFSGAVAYNYGYNSNTKRSVIWTGSGYDLNLEFYNHDFLFEGGYQVKGLFFIHALLGFSFRHTDMEVWSVYPDGSRSMGYEYDINGFYQTEAINIELGGSLGFRCWHFFFPIRISYGLPFLPVGELIDFDANRWRSEYFPSDYNAWVNDPAGGNEQDYRVPDADFSGLRIQFGVEFMLPLFKNAGL